MPGDLKVQLDTSDLRRAYAQLKAASAQLPREYRKSLVAITKPAVAAVKSSASWSNRIPAAVKTRVSFGRSARIEIYVDARMAPHAAAIDHRGKGGTFRRPVYADASKPRSDWAWVSQPAHPFLEPAVNAHLPQIEAGLLDTTMTVLRKAGFR